MPRNALTDDEEELFVRASDLQATKWAENLAVRPIRNLQLMTLDSMIAYSYGGGYDIPSPPAPFGDIVASVTACGPGPDPPYMYPSTPARAAAAVPLWWPPLGHDH